MKAPLPVRLWFLSLALLCAACSTTAPPDKFGARPISFDALPGWRQDNHEEALRTFLSTCTIFANKARPATKSSGIELSNELWRSLCVDAARAQYGQDAARLFFESRFIPYRVNNNGKESGLFTGYYEPVLYGSYHKQGDFIYPLYLAPPEIAKSKPYYTHAEINRGKLSGRGLELVWVDDPVMRFFLQIQGSGRVKMTDGKVLHIGYAEQNGHKYVAIGKIARDEKLLPSDGINFFTLRWWLYRNPDKAFWLMEQNPSYVFFKKSDKEGAVGAAGAVLTPARSMAVDSAHIPYGLPLYLETELPAEPGREPTPFKRLMIAQDTGGAIKGPVRGDIFFGVGDQAEYYAGYMAKQGVYSILVPREIAHQIKE